MIWLALYIGSILAANWTLAHYGILSLGFGLSAPAGVLWAGLALCLRDLVQDRLGQRWTIAAILAGALLSYLVSPTFAVASGLAFLFSETADFLVYTPLRARGHWVAGILASNTVGDIVDSALFLWLAFGSLDYLTGQIVLKWAATVPFILGLWIWRRRDALPVGPARPRTVG